MARPKGQTQPIRTHYCEHCGSPFKAGGAGYCDTRCLISANISILENGCWEWTGFKTKRGYGSAWCRAEGTNRRAHRLSYAAFVAPIEKQRLACHRCDNPSCVNFGHIFLGSQSDNILDAQAKGRLPQATRRGEHCNSAKLTADQVLAIRADARAQAEIAQTYNVRQSAISRIRARKRWAHLD